MTKFFKACALVGALMIAAGVILAVAGIATGGTQYLVHSDDHLNVLGWNWNNQNSIPRAAVKKQEHIGAFRSIRVDGSVLELCLRPSDTGEYGVVLEYSTGMTPPEWKVDGDTLEIHSPLSEKFYNLNQRQYRVTVTYPQQVLLDAVQVELDAAAIFLENLKMQRTEIRCNALDLNVTRADLGNLLLRANVANVEIEDSTARNAAIDCNTGNLECDGFDTDGMEVEINVGNLEIAGALRGESTFHANMGTISLAPSLSRDAYYIERTGAIGGAQAQGAENAPHHIRMEGLGGGEVIFSRD